MEIRIFGSSIWLNSTSGKNRCHEVVRTVLGSIFAVGDEEKPLVIEVAQCEA